MCCAAPVRTSRRRFSVGEPPQGKARPRASGLRRASSSRRRCTCSRASLTRARTPQRRATRTQTPRSVRHRPPMRHARANLVRPPRSQLELGAVLMDDVHRPRLNEPHAMHLALIRGKQGWRSAGDLNTELAASTRPASTQRRERDSLSRAGKTIEKQASQTRLRRSPEARAG